MVEPILFAALGALVATLVALLIVPLLWARAVRLTTRRLAGRLPMSVSEIVAAQDRLRAEHATKLRSTERRSEAAVAEAARERIEAGRARSEELGFKAEIADLKANVAALEESGALIRINLDRTGADAAAAKAELEAERAARATATRDLEAARKKLGTAEFARDTGRVELAAVETELAAARGELAEAARETARLRKALAARESAAEAASGQIDAMGLRLANAETARTKLERRLDERTAAPPLQAEGSGDPELAALRARLDELADEIVRAAGANESGPQQIAAGARLRSAPAPGERVRTDARPAPASAR